LPGKIVEASGIGSIGRAIVGIRLSIIKVSVAILIRLGIVAPLLVWQERLLGILLILVGVVVGVALTDRRLQCIQNGGYHEQGAQQVPHLS